VSAAPLPSLKDASGSAARRFHLDAPGWHQEPETPELLPAVAEAVWDDRLLFARYRRQGIKVRRELAPYGLVLKAGVWYLCARADGGTGSVRVYRFDRFDRFAEVSLGEERFVRDEDFDLPGFWKERAAQFARSILRTEVVVRLSEAGARQLLYATDRAAAREALETAGAADGLGRVTVTLPVGSLDVAYTQLLGLGPELEILKPAELRDRFATAAARLHSLYT
jgi:predicted DNA-binding transcriptional regulator YafY